MASYKINIESDQEGIDFLKENYNEEMRDVFRKNLCEQNSSIILTDENYVRYKIQILDDRFLIKKI